MQKLVKLIFFMLLCNMSFAQKHHFIYFENSSKQWFTIKLNDKVYESVGKNCVTISKLENGIYTLFISTQTVKENQFIITIDGADKGYSIKQNENKELALFDINSFVTINQDAKNKEEFIVNKEDETKKTEALKTEIITEKQPIKSTLKNKVNKIYNKQNEHGIDEIYVDGKDTILVYISIKEEEKKIKLVDGKADTAKLVIKSVDNSDETNNSNKTATETDVLNFITTTQVEPAIKSKLKTAISLLQQKNYTVNQIKRLSSLFINDKGKFAFFKQAQKFVSDKNNFYTLKTELTDAAIIEEFNAFINQL